MKTIDQQIESAVLKVWQQSGYAHLRHIRCAVKEGTVFITGSVPSYLLKQIAQEQIRGLPQIRQIVNQLLVCSVAEQAEIPSHHLAMPDDDRPPTESSRNTTSTDTDGPGNAAPGE